jgi:hypothetical protein
MAGFWRPRTFVVAVTIGLVAGLTASCTECWNDQDCATKIGKASSLCVSGACIEAAPETVLSATCDGDGDCSNGERCIDGTCAIVPTCQQLSGNFQAVRQDDGARGEVQAKTTGCRVQLTVAFEDGTLEIEADGIAADGALESPIGFTRGSWSSVERMGTLEGFNRTTVRFGTQEYLCRTDGDCSQQLVRTCRTPCDGPEVCAADAACDDDGFCRARRRGVCR